MNNKFEITIDARVNLNFTNSEVLELNEKIGRQKKHDAINYLLKQADDMRNKKLARTIKPVPTLKECLKPLVVHASDCHKLMTNPQRKSDELSETTKTWLKEKAVERILGLRKKVATKPMMKGILCEPKAIELYNMINTSELKKNCETKEQNGFCGTPDLIRKEGIVEIKTSWDASTFPFFQEDVEKALKKAGYDWQCRVYMMLFGINKAEVCYCLIDTPKTTPSGIRLLNQWDDMSIHSFHGIVPEHKRISISKVIERDDAIEQKMLERYNVANRFYQNYLEEIYNK